MKTLKMLLAAVLALVMLASMLPVAVFADGKGDYDRDDKVDTNDVRRIMYDLAKGVDITLTQTLWADMNFDSEISTSDARDLLRVLMTDDLESAGAGFATPTDKDYWGENSIAVLGDSISFGVGTSNDSAGSEYKVTGGIPERSYVSFVKKAVQAANDGKMNYGFTSAYPTAWPGVARSDEIHYWPERTNDANGKTAWVCDNNDDGNRLTSVGMTSVTPYSHITYRLRTAYADKYKYFTVYYQCEPNAGGLAIADGKGGEIKYADGTTAGYIPTASKDGTSTTQRTKFFKLSDCPKDSHGVPEIQIWHSNDTNPVTITGIGYYKALPQENNADGYVTFNSFTRGGISLINLSDDVLDKATSADTFIMGLGFNDFNFNHVRVNNGEFEAKIDTLIRLCNEKGTRVIVNDYAIRNPVLYANWIDSQRSANTIVKEQLRRFAEETNGIYIDQEALWGNALYASVNDKNEIGASSSMTEGDKIHPNHAGHRMMAQAVVAALGLEWAEEWVE